MRIYARHFQGIWAQNCYSSTRNMLSKFQNCLIQLGIPNSPHPNLFWVKKKDLLVIPRHLRKTDLIFCSCSVKKFCLSITGHFIPLKSFFISMGHLWHGLFARDWLMLFIFCFWHCYEIVSVMKLYNICWKKKSKFFHEILFDLENLQVLCKKQQHLLVDFQRLEWNEPGTVWDCSVYMSRDMTKPAKTDLTGRMPRLIWVFAGRTLTLLILSCRGSYGFKHTSLTSDGRQTLIAGPARSVGCAVRLVFRWLQIWSSVRPHIFCRD